MTDRILTQYSRCIYSHELYQRAMLKLCQLIPTLGIDAIAFRGSSGAAFAYPLWYKLGIPLLHSRKPGSHCSIEVEGTLGATRYCIVDDFIETGSTILEIVNGIKATYVKEKLTPPTLTHVILVREPQDVDKEYRLVDIDWSVTKMVGLGVY